MKVNIPFYPRFKDPMLNDIKVLTSRTRAMGKKGDTFDAFGATFEIDWVMSVDLGEVAEHWREEGCSSRQDFVGVWKMIHPRKGFDEETQVFAHHFHKVASLYQQEKEKQK